MAKPRLFFGVLLFALPFVANAQAPQDPYANDYAKEQHADYLKTRAEYLSKIGYVYFAIGCKVFPSEASALPLINSLGAAEFGTTPSSPIYMESVRDTTLGSDAQTAARTAMERSSRPGECDYWHQHPDEVYSLRSAAQAAMP